MRVFNGAAIACVTAAMAAFQTQSPADLQPLEVARLLAARYPREAPLGYIPALIWSGSLRLSALTGDDRCEAESAA